MQPVVRIIALFRAYAALSVALVMAFSWLVSGCGNGFMSSVPSETISMPAPGDPIGLTPPEDAFPSEPGVEPVELPTALWDSVRSEGPEWTQHVYKDLFDSAFEFDSAVPQDIGDFCPNYMGLSARERKSFWLYFVSVIAQFESGFRPEVSFQESFNDSRGRPVISRGLLQISIESANGYGCGFRRQSELHDPLRNLSCGVEILSHWLERDNRIAGGRGQSARGAGRYWSIFRPSHRRFQDVKDALRSAPMCNARID